MLFEQRGANHAQSNAERTVDNMIVCFNELLSNGRISGIFFFPHIINKSKRRRLALSLEAPVSSLGKKYAYVLNAEYIKPRTSNVFFAQPREVIQYVDISQMSIMSVPRVKKKSVVVARP